MQSIVLNDTYEIKTPFGWKDFKGIVKHSDKKSIKLKFNNNLTIISSPNHLFKNIDSELIEAKNCLNQTLITENGELIICIEIKETDSRDLFDILEIDGSEHLFYSNGLISHNCNLANEYFRSVYPTISASKTSKIVISFPSLS